MSRRKEKGRVPLRIPYEEMQRFDYVQLDVLADILEDLGLLWPDEPKVRQSNRPAEQNWNYRLPNGTTGSRDNRFQAAHDFTDHYELSMLKRETQLEGIEDEWENHQGTLHESFVSVRRALARLEVIIFMRQHPFFGENWHPLLGEALEGLSSLVTKLVAVVTQPKALFEGKSVSEFTVASCAGAGRGLKNDVDNIDFHLKEQASEGNFLMFTSVLGGQHRFLDSFWRLALSRRREDK